MKILIFPLLLTCTGLNAIQGISVESIGYIQSKEPLSALKIDYSYDFLSASNQSLFSSISWTQYFKKSFASSLGVGYRYHFPTYSIGINKFLDISNFSGKIAYQSGFGLDFIRYPFESHLNFYMPYKSNYYSNKYKIDFHKSADLYASYSFFNLIELIANPSYSFTSQQVGFKGGIGFSLGENVQLAAFYGNDFINKNHGVLCLNFGPGPEKRRHMTVKRSSHIRHEKMRVYKEHNSSVLPLAMVPVIPLATIPEFIPKEEEVKQLPIEEIKPVEEDDFSDEESPFFLRRAWNWLVG